MHTCIHPHIYLHIHGMRIRLNNQIELKAFLNLNEAGSEKLTKSNKSSAESLTRWIMKKTEHQRLKAGERNWTTQRKD